MTKGGDYGTEEGDQTNDQTTAKSSTENDISQANYVLVLLMTTFGRDMVVIQNTG